MSTPTVTSRTFTIHTVTIDGSEYELPEGTMCITKDSIGGWASHTSLPRPTKSGFWSSPDWGHIYDTWEIDGHEDWRESLFVVGSAYVKYSDGPDPSQRGWECRYCGGRRDIMTEGRVPHLPGCKILSIGDK